MSVNFIEILFLSFAVLMLNSSASSSNLPSMISKLDGPEKKESSGYLSEKFKQMRHQATKNEQVPVENIKIGSSFAPTSSVQSDFKQSDRQLNAQEDYDSFDLNFESTQIKDVVSFIEFKMNEITSLIQECIDQEFLSNPSIEEKHVRRNCIGSNYQILFYNYNEGIRKVRSVLIELLKLKLENLKEDYEDETNFFMDVLESLINKDYAIPESLELAKKAAKYYVSPRYFDRLVELTGPEIGAFSELHNRLRAQRNAIQEHIEEKVSTESEYVEEIEDRARKLKQKSHQKHLRHKHHRKMKKLQKQLKKRELKLATPSTNSQTMDPRMISNLSQQLPQDPFLNSVQGEMNNLDLYKSIAIPNEQPHQPQMKLNIEMPHPQQEEFGYDFQNKKI